jgi:hypothetical protein
MDITNGDGQTREQQTQPQAAAPPMAEGGTSPEARLEIVADNLLSLVVSSHLLPIRIDCW